MRPLGSNSTTFPVGTALGVITLGVGLAYANSLAGTFVYDDMIWISNNPSIRSLWPIGPVISPMEGLTINGRPLLNLSFALNYHFGGTSPWGYHLVNVLIHLLASLTLFGILHRTLKRPVLAPRFGTMAVPLATLAALLWALHPLLTEAVTYVAQRAESLMALFYLLAVYAFIRGTESARPTGWFAGSVLACLLGAATKEIIVTAPVIIFLYDRTFVAGSFRAAWAQRRPVYLGLAVTWAVLAYLMADIAGRGIGFGHDVRAADYLRQECVVIVRYLGLAVWPRPLVFDYGPEIMALPPQVIPYVILLGLLVIGTGVALVRRPAWGFAGCCFFIILAPTSSIVPIAFAPMAESRMYLPLVPVVTVIVLGLYARASWRIFYVLAALAPVLGFLTSQRNTDYRTETTLWTDTVAKAPYNLRARIGLGNALAAEGKMDAATAQLQAALAIKPDYDEAYHNLGRIYLQTGHPADAMAAYQAALKFNPRRPFTHYNLALMQVANGELDQALFHYQETVRLMSSYFAARLNLGSLLLQLGRVTEASREFVQVLRLQPESAEAYFGLGICLYEAGRFPEAARQFETAVRLKPDFVEALNNLGNALLAQGQVDAAIARYEEALRLNPGYSKAHQNLANLRAQLPKAP